MVSKYLVLADGRVSHIARCSKCGLLFDFPRMTAYCPHRLADEDHRSRCEDAIRNGSGWELAIEHSADARLRHSLPVPVPVAAPHRSFEL